MDWATAVGVSGGSAAIIALVVALVMAVNRSYQHGQDALESRSAQLDAEHFKRDAEGLRDAALVAQKAAEGAQAALMLQLERARDAARKLLEMRQSELLKGIDHANADEITALSQAVFGTAGASPIPAPAGPSSGAGPSVLADKVPASGAATDTASGSDQGTASAVSHR